MDNLTMHLHWKMADSGDGEVKLGKFMYIY